MENCRAYTELLLQIRYQPLRGACGRSDDQNLFRSQFTQQLAEQAQTLLEDSDREQELDDLLDQHGTGRVLFRNTRHVVKGFPAREVHPVVLNPLEQGDPFRHWLGELLSELRSKKVLVIAAAASTAQRLVADF